MKSRSSEFRPRLGLAVIVSFLAGSVSWYKIKGIGEIFGTELVLPVAALIALSARPLEGRLPKAYWSFASLALLMLGGYVFADILGRTETNLSFRAWARIVALISDFTCLSILVLRNRNALIAYGLGSAISNLLFVTMSGEAITRWNWKLVYGDHVATIVACISGALPSIFGSLAFAAFAIASLAMDSRAQGAVGFGVAGLLWLRGRISDKRSPSFKTHIGLLVILSVSASALIFVLNQTASDNSVRRTYSDIKRFAALRIGAEAILDNPIVGYGSWGNGTEKYARKLYSETASDVAALGQNVGSNPRAFQPHSQVLQAWIEGGLFAGMFFVIYGYQLAKALVYLIFYRPPDGLSTLLLWILMFSAWHLVMSPFAGFMRLNMAAAISIIVLFHAERNRSKTQTRQDLVSTRQNHAAG